MSYNAGVCKKRFNPLGGVLIIAILGLIFSIIFMINAGKSNGHSLELKESETFSKLEELSTLHPKVNKILNNVGKYPIELLDLLSKNIETLDFVYNYPKYVPNNKKISIKKYYTPGEIPLFLQWDEKWGYDTYGDNPMAISGCAPTALAMVAVGLTGDTSINPLSVSQFAYNNGHYVDGVGSSWSIISEGAKNFGLNSKELPLSKASIFSSLQKGNPIIVTVRPGTFTTTGHFLVLTGVTNDGKIIINDPNSKINSEKSWDVNVFLEETKNLWEISKL